jgi:hypothetical protein
MKRKIEIDENGIIDYYEIIDELIVYQDTIKPDADSRNIPGQLRHIVDAIHTPGIVNAYLDKIRN